MNMKKFFTFLAFLVVTVNAAAQNTITYLDVANNFSTYFKSNPTDDERRSGLKCFSDTYRLNVCGYPFYSKKQGWGWIDSSSSIGNGSNQVTDWVENEIFKGAINFFGNSAKYSAANTNATGDNLILSFNITNCSGIDVFLYHIPSTSPYSNYSGLFSIEARPFDENIGEFSTTSSSKTTENITDGAETKSYFPTLYGLDKNKIYKIVLSIPKKTYLYEFSFRKNPLSYQTQVTDGVNWGTMYLDFPVRIPNNENEHPNLIVYTVNTIVNNRCSVSPITTGSIPKNTGVLLYEPDVPTHETITFTETSEPDPVISILSGTAETDFTVAKALQDKSPTTRVLTLGREKSSGLVGFFTYNGTSLSQYKAYLTYDYDSSEGNVKGFYISGFDELTGVQKVEIESSEPGNWYSLQGVRLNARPTQRGIYLNNGKKVLVK